MGSLKACGGKGQEFTCYHWWVSFSRLHFLFPFFLQTQSTLFKQRTFTGRERCTSENRIPMQEEIVIEKQLSGLLAHTQISPEVPFTQHITMLWRNTPALSTCLVWEKAPALLWVVEVRRWDRGKTSQKSSFPGLSGFSSSALPLAYLLWWCLLPFPYAGCCQLKKQFSWWHGWNVFLGRTNPDLLILLPCAISKDQNMFGVLQQKDLQAAVFLHVCTGEEGQS